MNGNEIQLARRQGEAWAAAKAEALAGDMPACEWPDTWRPERRLELPAPLRALPRRERQALMGEARRAAAARWAELLLEARRQESVGEEELDDEARAVALVESLRRDLPAGLWPGYDGPRAFLQDETTGEEWTITSLGDAWRVVDEWKTQLVT